MKVGRTARKPLPFVLIFLVGTALVAYLAMTNDAVKVGGALRKNIKDWGMIISRKARTERGNDVYIAIRADGVSGSGTEVDPLDGSTASKMFAILTALPINTHLNLAPGTYQINVADIRQQSTMNYLVKGVIGSPKG